MSRQYGRVVDLVVADREGKGLNLSALRIQFNVKKGDSQTPNAAAIRVYNPNQDLIDGLRKEFVEVILQAGYEKNFGIIFRGNIKQSITGEENGGVDRFVDIYAGDGDNAINFSIVNTSLAAGASQADQVAAASRPMLSRGVEEGYRPNLSGARLPRGKVMYGMSRDYLRQSSEATETTWSVQDGKLQFIPRTELLPGQAIKLNSQTGMIGTPEQTEGGIKFTCLINSQLKIGGRVIIDEQDIQRMKPDLTKGEDKKKPVTIANDGVYRLLTVEFVGDNYGTEWYALGNALDVDATAPPKKKVKKA